MTNLEQEMLVVLKTLPLDSFGDDMAACDASDFVDHAGEFFEAMLQAKEVIRKIEGE